MSNKTKWEQQATNLLKAEMARRGLNYDDLREALAKAGTDKTTNNLRKIITQGKFQFAFFLECAAILGVQKIDLL